MSTTTVLAAPPVRQEPAPQPNVPAPGDSRSWRPIAVGAAVGLSACGGGGSAEATAAVAVPAMRSAQATTPVGDAAVGATTRGGGAAGPLGQVRNYAVPGSDAEAARFLLHAQFSAVDEEIASVRALGYAGWLATQFEVVAINTAWTWINQQGYSAVTLSNFQYVGYPVDFAVWWQLFNTPDQVRKRVALALSEIFVVSTTSGAPLWTTHVFTNWWDMLSTNALGNFRTLLEAVTLHPAMGYYLNIIGSQKEDGTGRQPDENYAREVMQLMTIGLVNLNPDGTAVTSGGLPVESYTQDDVSNLARVFTGYDLNLAGNAMFNLGGFNYNGITFSRLPLLLKPALHSTMDVNFLGVSIPGTTEGNAARKIALDTLFNHPNVGPFIGTQLIQRLVTSNPSPAYVARVSAAFADNGRGVRGDLAATVAAILLDDEAQEPAGLTSPTFGRLREPMVRVVQWARSFGLKSAAGTWKFYEQSSSAGLLQSPLRSPSVFNFFRPGYVPQAPAIVAANMVAPEFQLVNETTVASYVNTMQQLLRYGLFVNSADRPEITNGVGSSTNSFDLTATYARELAIVQDPAALVARLNLVLAGGQLSAATVALMVSALGATPVVDSSNAASRLNVLCGAILMVMTCSEYLVQK
jgi:uncharacterized protein (DUF1800 family)